jgi:hypothetical protein
VACGSIFVELKFTHECGKVGHIEDIVVGRCGCERRRPAIHLRDIRLTPSSKRRARRRRRAQNRHDAEQPGEERRLLQSIARTRMQGWRLTRARAAGGAGLQ